MIVRAIKQLFSPSSFQEEAHLAYIQLVEQSRKPWFYRDQGIADTVDGRFDVIVLHLFLTIHRLRKERSEEAAQFIRAISEAFFADMDRSLREMGSTDTGTGMRVKKMAQAFYGRLQAYEQGLLDPQLFQENLRRNLYREQPVDAPRLQAIADYAHRNIAHLEQLATGDILLGVISFSD